MMKEEDRLRELRALELLDTIPEEEFDQAVRLAAEICGTPISVISLVDADRQWFKASVGLNVRETHRDLSFCSHAIETDELFEVEDATKDPRFQDNPLVTAAPGIRFYAGLPLQTPSGALIGTLSVIDTVPRSLSEGQRSTLIVLGRQVQVRIHLRSKQKALEAALAENRKLTASLEESDKLFRAFMNTGPFLSYIKDADGRYVFYNIRMNERFGVAGQEWIGRADEELWPRDMAEQYRKHDLDVMAGGVPVEMAEVTPAQGGAAVTHWKSFKFPIRSQSGEVLLGGLSLDVTEEMEGKRELEQTLREKDDLAGRLNDSHVLFRTFLDRGPNHAYLKTEDGRYVFYNRSFAEHFRIGQEDWIGKTDGEVLPREIADRFRAHEQAAMQSEEAVERSDRLMGADGRVRAFKSLRFTYKDASGNKMLAGVGIDITEQVEQQKALLDANLRLEQLVRTDSLTGLPNRRVFEEQIEVEFRLAVRKKRTMSVLVLDIDNFKRRNDRYGHAAGDEALRILAAVLQGSGRVGDLPARIGGEEFAFLLPETDREEAKVIAARIQTLLRVAFSGTSELTVSIGIACTSETTPTWKRLVACADDAMYVAKSTGKNRAVLHDDYIASMMAGLEEMEPPRKAANDSPAGRSAEMQLSGLAKNNVRMLRPLHFMKRKHGL